METKIGKKVVIVTEEFIKDEVLKMITDFGAEDYTVGSVITGKGVRGVTAGAIVGNNLFATVRIEIITTKKIGEEIGAALADRFAKHHKCLVYIENVDVIYCKKMAEIAAAEAELEEGR